MADDRTYIRVHDGMDEHPKIEDLSDGAFRLLMRCWFYCSRNLTDGRIAEAAWKKRGTPRSRAELIAAGLAVEGAGYVEMHDYLEHQRSAEEIRLLKEHRGDTGTLGNHVRWHVVRRKPKQDCEHCFPPDDPDRKRIANAIANGSQTHRKVIASTEAETEAEDKNSVRGGSHVSRADDEPPRCSQHKGMPRAEVPNCWACGHKREQWEASRAADAVFQRAPWCGDDECDPTTRQRDTGLGVIRCPECHPLAKEAS